MSIRIAVLGASGYTGAELLRLLALHPQADVKALSAESQAGKRLAEVFPHLSALDAPLQKIDEIDFTDIDLVFCCLPHGTTQPVLAGLPESVRIVDLSADFRLFKPEAYEEWYGHPHQALALQENAVYGLSEWYGKEVAAARLVANPGCYPTCVLTPVLPLVKAGLVDPQRLIIDAMSGVSGAGRKAAVATSYCEINESFKAYGVGGHRHVAEMEQEVARAAGLEDCPVSFTAHLVPMTRGMQATIHTHVDVDAAQLRACLKDHYANAPFVTICDHIPATAEVRGSNHCRIAVENDRRSGKAIIISVIDNLLKGASGQALQNMNLMYGLPETTALEGLAVLP
jgi:N-acetyl-gamma-glutamyl-phosphate reductase